MDIVRSANATAPSRVRRFAKGMTVRNRSVSKTSRVRRRRWASMCVAAVVSSIVGVGSARAQGVTLPPITVGAGLRTSFAHTEPESGDGTDRFQLDDIRLYVNGSVTSKIKVMFNTAYGNGARDPNGVQVLDAAGRFEFSDKFNVWVGRFLPPSDRANLYGPYYAHHWAVYTDGIQDGYPFIYQGRDNGAAYWGQFGKVKLSGGAFDGATATSSDNLLVAGRAQVDFWDPEGGYYLNGTYYGDKNLLALGFAGQAQKAEAREDAKNALSADFLLERKVGMGGAYTVEAEWARYHRLGGYNARYGKDDGAYVLASYLFPALVGQGRFEALAKYAYARFEEGITRLDADYHQKTTELNLNYVIKQFDARIMIFYHDTRFDLATRPDSKRIGVGLQLQM
jgi:hypothetical protein